MITYIAIMVTIAVILLLVLIAKQTPVTPVVSQATHIDIEEDNT